MDRRPRTGCGRRSPRKGRAPTPTGPTPGTASDRRTPGGRVAGSTAQGGVGRRQPEHPWATSARRAPACDSPPDAELGRSAANAASPKSRSFGVPSSRNPIFAGLTSLCSAPALWTSANHHARHSQTLRAWPISTGPCRRRSASVPPAKILHDEHPGGLAKFQSRRLRRGADAGRQPSREPRDATASRPPAKPAATS